MLIFSDQALVDSREYLESLISSWSCFLHHAAYPHHCSLLYSYVQLTHHFINSQKTSLLLDCSAKLLKNMGNLGHSQQRLDLMWILSISLNSVDQGWGSAPHRPHSMRKSGQQTHLYCNVLLWWWHPAFPLHNSYQNIF